MKLTPGVQITETDVSIAIEPGMVSGVVFDDKTRTILYSKYESDVIHLCKETIKDKKEYFKRKLKGK